MAKPGGAGGHPREHQYPTCAHHMRVFPAASTTHELRMAVCVRACVRACVCVRASFNEVCQKRPTIEAKETYYRVRACACVHPSRVLMFFS